MGSGMSTWGRSNLVACLKKLCGSRIISAGSNGEMCNPCLPTNLLPMSTALQPNDHVHRAGDVPRLTGTLYDPPCHIVVIFCFGPGFFVRPDDSHEIFTLGAIQLLALPS